MMDEDVHIKMFHLMDLCVKCNKNNGKLLTCHDNACPMVVHQDCLGSEANFDDMGNFTCPYCVFKRASRDVFEAERKAVLAEKTLFKFLQGRGGEDTEVVETGNVTGRSTDVRDQCVELGKYVTGAEFSMRDKGADVSLVNGNDFIRVKVVDKRNEVGVNEICSGEGKVDQQKNVDMNERSQSGDKIQNDAARTETFPKYHHNAGHCKAHKPIENIVCKESVPQVQKEANRKVNDTTASICMDTDIISEEVTGARPPCVNIPKGSSRKSSKVVNRKLPAPKMKRKRSAWTVEEEDKLKEGVKKHSEIVNKNIPWKKILEEGGDVFDETRTPADLKDKWRNILAKEPIFKSS